MDIVLFKLSTSEEVISRVDDVNVFTATKNETITLNQPRILAPTQVLEDRVSLAPIPWFMGAQDPHTGIEYDVIIKSSAIIAYTTEIPEALSKMYISKTSGISLT